MVQTPKMPSKILDGSIITLFNKTREPEVPTDVVCPHFLELKWGWGCPYDCSFCYLKGTFRYSLEEGRVKPHFKLREKVKSHVEAFLSLNLEPTILNSGELSDSLMGEGLGEPFSEFLMPLFRGTRHRVLFLTKGVNVTHFLEHPEFAENAILSWSLNASSVASRWERLAPRVEDRLGAARRVYEAGYEVRVRVDPIFPEPEYWDAGEYLRLIDLVFKYLRPERITLGSLRGLKSTIDNVKDRSWLRYLGEESGWGKKPRHEERFTMYSALMKYLKTEHGFEKVGLCKETLRIWRELGLDWERNCCNCVA